MPSPDAMRPTRRLHSRVFGAGAVTVLLLCLLSACAHKNKGTPDNEPTLKTLAQRTVDVRPDRGPTVTPEQAIKAYSGFLALAPAAAQREEAMRRMGDLEMDSADSQGDAPDYRAAVARYQELLKTFPNSPGNDRVLYQLARAQEQGGDLGAALKTLDKLVANYPQTASLEEAQFRRGELLFTQQNYAQAEVAYSTVLRSAAGPDGNRYHDRALYMQGWSRFKQGKLEEALQAFFGVLDVKLASLDSNGDNVEDDLQSLSRAERELVEDTFRVSSLCLANLQGAESIAPYINTPERQAYAYMVYAQLGELYLKQERVKDAADTFALFARQRPLEPQAPLFQARVIAVYERNGFTNLALEAKKEYVARYGQASALRQANPQGWQKAQPVVQTHLAELARHYHAQAQASKQSADYQEAVHWYRDYLSAFPTDAEAARNNFLLAELLFEDQHYAEAAVEYEKTAYGYAAHADSADAGYGALLAYAKQQGLQPASAATPATTTATAGTSAAALQQVAVDSALRFVQRFASDPRAAPVLADAAEKLFALQQPARAAAAAQQLLDLQPPPAQRRVAWTVLAHTRFEAADYAGAEQAYAEVLTLIPEGTAGRSALVERQAAAIYKQGEQARADGKTRDALAHFERAARSAGAQSPVQVAAQYDAAAAQLVLKDWAGATRTLEDFRRRYPANPLQAELAEKLALAYGEQGQWAAAAGEYERMAGAQKDPALARAALWQAATLQDKATGGDAASTGNGAAAASVASATVTATSPAAGAAAKAAASRLYTRYLTLYPQPLEPALEARWALARMAKAEGNSNKQLALLKDLLQAEQADTGQATPGQGSAQPGSTQAGAAHSARVRYLAASAALALAEPVAEAYRKIALIEPLQKQLKLKKAKMEEALKAYALATDYGVADVSTEASYRIATVYRDFGKALMGSERPKKLNKLEREQYGVMLEEQAYPFEEKATEIYTLNAQRAASGLYDVWVRNSFEALRELLPVRYGKTERGEGSTSGSVQTAANASASAPVQAQVQALNQRGITQRQAGAFAEARAAYEQALALDANYRNAILNLGILQDLYVGDARQAQALYERYLALTPEGDATVAKWLAEIKNRKEKP